MGRDCEKCKPPAYVSWAEPLKAGVHMKLNDILRFKLLLEMLAKTDFSSVLPFLQWEMPQGIFH